MLNDTLKISKNESIPIHYCDLDFNESTNNKSTLTKKIANFLKLTGRLLSSPLDWSSSLFTKGHHITPGSHVILSSYTTIDKLLKRTIAFTYYTAGSIGAILSVIPAGIGVGCYSLAKLFHDPQFNCTVTGSGRKELRSNSEAVTNSTNSFKFLTRNTALVPNAIAYYGHLRNSDERLIEIAASIPSNLDALCLQEVFGEHRSQKLVSLLKGKFKYFIYNIGPRALGLDSGLLFASNMPIICGRFVRPPLPTFIKANNPIGITTSIESFTNKGILFVLVKHKDEYKIFVNAHIKSNMSFDHEEAAEIQRVRADGLRVLTIALFDYISDLEDKLSIRINNVVLGGDLNVSDFQETGIWNYERSGIKNGVRVRHGMSDLSFIFENLFPSPSVNTWLIDESRTPNDEETGYGQRHYNRQQKPLKDVQFDHASVFENHLVDCPKHTNEAQPCFKTLKFSLRRFDDQGKSRFKGSPSSDHAGILLEAEHSCTVNERHSSKTRRLNSR